MLKVKANVKDFKIVFNQLKKSLSKGKIISHCEYKYCITIKHLTSMAQETGRSNNLVIAA